MHISQVVGFVLMKVQWLHCQVEPMGGKGDALAPTNEVLLPTAPMVVGWGATRI